MDNEIKDLDAEPPLKLSREDLFELAWSKPITELAKDFGISDVALAKRCRRLGVPLPGRGYWARIDAGQEPHRPKLPKRELQSIDRNALTVPIPSPARPELTAEAWRAESQDDVWLAERIAFEERHENEVVVELPPSRWDPVVCMHRDQLRAEAKEVVVSRAAHERYEKWPEKRKQGWDTQGWKWRSIERSGQRLLDGHKSKPFRVTMETLERALAIVNAIAVAGKSRGFTLRDDGKEGRISIVGHAAELQFRITEQLATKVRSSSWRKGETENYKVPTGRLRITVTDGWREGPIFEDKGSISLESTLRRFFIALYKLVVKQWRAAREAKVRQEQQRLAAQRRAEEERIRAEQEAKAEAERQKRLTLSAEAQKWEEAQRIRGYVEQLLEAATEQTPGGALGATHAWANWALSVAEELDPTARRRANGDD